MTSAPSGSTLRRRVLAGELRDLRRAAGLTHIDVASRLGWQQGKVSKIESAKQGVPVEAVIALADICHAAPEQRERLVQLAMQARSKDWWERYTEVLPPHWKTYIGLETDADSIDMFGTEIVPELLQTQEYAIDLQRNRVGLCPREGSLERNLELLLRRQQNLLEARTPELRAVLTEAALQRAVGGSQVLRRQVVHLAELSSRPHVTIRVLPFEAGALPVDVPFAVLGFQEIAHPDVVFVPNRVGGVYYEHHADVQVYRTILRELEARSLGPEDSAGLLTKLGEGTRTYPNGG